MLVLRSLLPLALVSLAFAQTKDPADFFETRVRPVLATNCYGCHTSGQSGGLRLDSAEAALKGGNTGPAIVPGKPEESLLIQAVRQSHEKLKMPPGKKLADQEIADLAEWIQAGAVWPKSSGAVSRITAQQKAFWSFQPLKDAAPPLVKDKRWAAEPIDRFILAKLEEKGLQPAPAADRRTLIRRVTYDLTGLPPTPEEIDAFLRDKSPKAYARVVDRLLASPRYGERWGRHWLDVVRYADSAGDSADYPVPQAYLYRDYVIQSFNRDKPYDQFLREQIAGDLLPHKNNAERWEHTVATGYLAIAKRFSVVPEEYMYLTIDDTIDNLGKAVLGLSVSCARCHDHKYDPISSKDYYALFGIFDSTRYPFAGSENVKHQQDMILHIPQAEADAILKPWTDKLAPIDAELLRLDEERKAFNTKGNPIEGRTLVQIQAEIKELKARRLPIAMSMPVLDKAYAVAEGKPHNAHVLLRGDPKNLGDEVPRRFPEILGGQALPAGTSGSGRLDLANWITDPKNPLTARVMVNRIWQNHFGRGLVSSPSDFGKRGKPPSHPELLDYLAKQFMADGWSVKAMQRRIVLSQTYQQSSMAAAPNLAADPGNELLSHFNRQRLDAESIRDALLAVSGSLEFSGASNPHPFPQEPMWDFTQHKPFNAVYDSQRRSVYLMTQRIQRQPYLAVFDGADPNASTPERTATTTPIQALFMMNSEFLHEQADRLAERLTEATVDSRQQVDRAHEIALGRPPAADEERKAEEYLQAVKAKLAAAGIASDQLTRKTLGSYLRALLSSDEFIFVD